MQLPFQDGTFGAIVCQFGVMFCSDKSKAFAEARRVLRPGGVFIFNVWDRITENEFADTVTAALEPLFPRIRLASWPARPMAVTTVAPLSEILPPVDSWPHPELTRSRRAVGQHPPGSPRSRTVRGHPPSEVDFALTFRWFQGMIADTMTKKPSTNMWLA
jgi:SAM-dependent methyltransferase